jgi:PKD repeat protein
VSYSSPGAFDVSLTVINPSGSNTVTYDNFIEVDAPTISDFTSFVNGLEATFSNQSQNSTSSLWFFGDGEQSNANNPSHIYNQDGLYGHADFFRDLWTDTSTQQVVIQTPPQSGFSLQQTDFCIPASVNFVNESSNNATSFLWTFGWKSEHLL